MPAWPKYPRSVQPPQDPSIPATGPEFPACRTAVVLHLLIHGSRALHRREIAKPRRARRCNRISGRGLRFRAERRMPGLRLLKMRLTFPENGERAPAVE